jgi:signal transduction histidine kinase
LTTSLTIGTYTIGHTANLLQLGEFLLCSVILYEVFRWHYLKRQDTQLAQSELARELHIAEVRTAFVKQVLLTLRDDIESCKHLKNSLEPSDTTELIQEGLMRLNAMIAKFEVALELKERGSVTESKRVQLADLLSAALKPLEPQIKEKKLTIQQTSCELRTQSPPLLTYVLRSIVDNAISYSQPNNSIAISSRLTDHETRVAIEDHGSGIPQDRLSILFQPFSKAEGAETFDHEGMGFDLYLDKIIADYLNGKISITSEPKKGTRVELAFPS